MSRPAMLAALRGGMEPATAAWTPAALGATVKLWTEPEGLSGVNDDPITSWTDGSGNANHPTVQGSNDNRPTVKTNVLNGKAVARFDGGTDHLVTPSINLPDITSAAVVKFSAAGFYPMVLARAVGECELRCQGGSNIPEFAVNADAATWGAPVGTSAFHILVATYSDAANLVSISVDGATPVTTVTAGSLGVPNTVTTVGARTGPGLFFAGDVAATLQCDTALSAPNIALLVAFWQAKFGL